MMAIRGTDLAQITLDYWIAGGGAVVLEWAEGPTAEEICQYLLDCAVESGGLDLTADDLALDPSRPQTQTDRVHLRTRGVPVQIRDLDPVGLTAALDRVDTERRQALHAALEAFTGPRPDQG